MKLGSSVETLSLVGPTYAKKLEKLGIKTVEDLLFHIPNRYDDFSLVSTIMKAHVGNVLTIKGKIESIKNQYTRSGKKMQIGEVSDSTGKITVLWFNQPFLVRALYPGVEVSLSGKVDFFGNKRALISPEYEILRPGKKSLHTGRLVPVYPETSGLSSKWLRGRIKETFNTIQTEFEEFLPDETLEKYDLENFSNAVRSVHFPEDAKNSERGKRRLAFNELLFLQLASAYKKLDWQKNRSVFKLSIQKEVVGEFINSLPFNLTPSQKRAISEITKDLSQNYPMNRLLEGDVGSGKTVVAAYAAFMSFTNGYQTVLMAPTQILAEQHFKTLQNLFSKFKVRISLITSDVKRADAGRTDIFVGTHALTHNKIVFDRVSLVIIDEQHRFGVEQRAHLTKKTGAKSQAPHVLTMTATPIPRTVALTYYGDLDLSTIDELPKNRQKITTWVVPPQKREGAYKWIRSQIADNRSQAFVVCPLIEEGKSETTKDVKAVTTEHARLKKIFKNLKLGLLHGRMASKEKNKVLDDFRNGKTNLLVSTPVVEVGIDIANATVMLIEDADRFGLAQLHQLRGRVGRGDKKSYCLLFSDLSNEKVLTRLNAMTKTASGFELAELDLKLRGPGEIFGTAQSGFPELKIASWNDFALIKDTKLLAQKAMENPKEYPKLLSVARQKQLSPN